MITFDNTRKVTRQDTRGSETFSILASSFRAGLVSDNTSRGTKRIDKTDFCFLSSGTGCAGLSRSRFRSVESR